MTPNGDDHAMAKRNTRQKARSKISNSAPDPPAAATERHAPPGVVYVDVRVPVYVGDKYTDSTETKTVVRDLFQPTKIEGRLTNKDSQTLRRILHAQRQITKDASLGIPLRHIDVIRGVMEQVREALGE